MSIPTRTTFSKEKNGQSLCFSLPLLFDGATGTLYQALPHHAGRQADFGSLQEPDTIRSLHQAYIDAGARAIKTNTFGLSALLEEGRQAEADELLQASAKIALEFQDQALIFGDLGPTANGSKSNQMSQIYIHQAASLYELGIRYFLIETLSTLEGIDDLASWMEKQPEPVFLLVSFAVGPDGFTPAGLQAADLLEKAAALPGVDGVGLNCHSGPHHMKMLWQGLPKPDVLLSCMPNAGYPSVVGRKVVYDSDPQYFASQMQAIYNQGIDLLGGCCGTSPAHIAAVKQHLHWQPLPESLPEEVLPHGHENEDSLYACFERKRKVAAVELDPPKNDQVSTFLQHVRLLQKAGVDFITIADCPIGRPRADSSLLACKIKRELGMDVLPHMTCRDRNLNAIKALLMGLSMEDLHSVLIITGDPIPSSLKEEVKSVFSFNSRKLASYIRQLYPQTVSSPFHVFGALNINAHNFDTQLKLALEKEANGMVGFLSQPALSRQALANLKKARHVLKGKILGGILPVVSHRNALFLQNEVNGIEIERDLLERYQNTTRQEAEALALEISLEMAEAMQDDVDGYYIMTPFNRTALVCRLLKEMQERKLI